MHGAYTRRRSRSIAFAGVARSAIAAALGASVVLFSSAPAWAAAENVNHVRDVSVHTSAGVPDGAEIEVSCSAAPVYTVRAEDGGRRLLVDLRNAELAGAPAVLTSPLGVVGGVFTQSFKTDAGTLTRVTVSLSKGASYRVKTEGTRLRIILTPTGVPIPSPKAASSAPAAGDPQVQDVRFERAGAVDRVVVKVDRMPAYGLSSAPGGRIRLELKGTALPEALARLLDVTAYHGALKSVGAFRDAATGSTIVEIDRDDGAQGSLSLEGGALVWSFPIPKPKAAAPAAAPAPVHGADGGPARRVVTVARERLPADIPTVSTNIHATSGEDPQVETVEGQEAGFAAGVNGQVRNQRYAGRRIDLDLKDADIHNILRLLADVGHVNIVTADDVAGSISIRMRNVPWDQALDVVLQAKGLGMVRQGNLIRVAPMAQLQKERELRLAQAKQEYELTPLETRLIPVSYAQADELQARAKELLSPRGSIAVDERTNVLIARDIAANLNHIEELVRSLDTQTPQVLVEARIVEATSRYLRDVGIQWGGDATFSEATGNPTGIAFPSRVLIAGGNYDNNTPTAGLSPFQRQIATPNFAVNMPAAVGTGQGGAIGMTFGSIDNNFNVPLRLSAAEASGLLRVVSAPRILTLDNKEARINSGTLIPFAQVSALGVQTTFQEAKLQLLVKPHVTADGSVSMHVKVSRDEPDFNQTSPRGDPTILKREAETDLLVMDGHTAVIGGIYTRNTGRNLDQVPFFGDLPVIGLLFQRRRATDQRNELVIFLTPRIVNRAEALGR